MAYAQCKTVSHARRVCAAYRKILRAMTAEDAGSDIVVNKLEPLPSASDTGYYFDFETEEDENCILTYPYARELIRHEFEKNRHVTDMVKARELLGKVEEAIHEHLFGHEEETAFIDDPGGLEYQRHEVAPDWIFDTWHPLERLQYPKFFGLRNLRKLEHVERWNAKHGKPAGAPDFSHLKEEFVKHVHAMESKTDKPQETEKSS